MKAIRYYWVHHPDEIGETLREVGILEDGSLFNPNHYPDDLVRRAVAAANAERRDSRSQAAKKAARTRREGIERRTYRAAQIILSHSNRHCYICGKRLSDEESIVRGIGSECWQDVLKIIIASRAATKRLETPTPVLDAGAAVLSN